MQVYLLAAGAGRRSGGPKAWRKHESKTLLEKQLNFLLARFPARALTVSIQGPWRRRCETINPGVHWIAVDPAQSPLAALQTLLKACPQQDWAFLYHVDMPVWEPPLFERLEKEARQQLDAIVPIHDGRKGHPVLLSPRLSPEILALDPATNRLDHWLRAQRLRAVEVGLPCVLENWNAAAP